MMAFIISLILLTSVLLILVVLAQDAKGGGLTGNVGNASQIIGVRKTSDWIEKLTWGLGIAVFVLALVANTVVERETAAGYTSPNIERAKQDAPAVPGTEATPSVDELLENTETPSDSAQ